MRHQILIVATDSHVDSELLTGAIADTVAATRGDINVVRVLIPAVLPSTLPISAWPPRLAERLGHLRDAAAARAESLRPRGRVEIVPCRSVSALLQAVWPVDTLVLVGRTGWGVRRAARGAAANVVLVPPLPARRRREPAVTSQPKALPE